MNDKGQGTVEYIVLLAIVVSFLILLGRFMNDSQFNSALLGPVTNDLRRAYTFGYVKTKGFKNEAPENHPRVDGSGNFRIFFYPRRDQ